MSPWALRVALSAARGGVSARRSLAQGDRSQSSSRRRLRVGFHFFPRGDSDFDAAVGATTLFSRVALNRLRLAPPRYRDARRRNALGDQIGADGERTPFRQTQIVARRPDGLGVSDQKPLRVAAAREGR